MEISRHLDWLTITIPQTHNFRGVFPTLAFTFLKRGRYGFKSQFVNVATGILVNTDSDNPEMGHNFVFSGETLTNIRQEMGGDDVSLVSLLARNKGKASRIDLTINIHDGLLTPRKVQQAVKSGAAKPKANVSRFIEGKNGKVEGDTFYIGSPTSDRQFRCYDKASELGIVNRRAWVRLELELRRLRANGAFQSVASNGIDSTVSGHMGDFLDWRDVEYQTALGGKSVPPVDIPRKSTNRQRWLLGQVASALAKEIALDRGFYERFKFALAAECERLDVDLTAGE